MSAPAHPEHPAAAGTGAGEQAPAPEPFGVLMPLWAGDRPDRFRAAALSATLDQELAPHHLLLGIDGPLPAELEAEVRALDERLPAAGIALHVMRHPRHRGLAAVLQDGLRETPTDVIARADADDLCRPARFARQLPVLTAERLDLLGCAMQEFSDTVPPGTGPLRRRPLTHEEIRAYLPGHSPFHHPTVVMRASAALAAGGYRELDHLEDYWLWERMLLAGARTANLPDVLVDYRVDPDLYARRGGLGMLASDVRLQRILHADGVVGTAGLVRNLVRRACYRLAPGSLRRLGYRLLVERRAGGQR